MRCQGTSVGNYTSQKFEIHFITTVSLLQSPYYIIHKRIYYIRGPEEKSKRLNKLESNILKPKNQVTLFVNYSYNSFTTFALPKIYIVNEMLCAKIWDF